MAPHVDLIGPLAAANPALLGLATLLLLLAAADLGFRIGHARFRAAPPGDAETSSVGFVTTGMLGTFAFLLGIGLSMACGRYCADPNACFPHRRRRAAQ